MTSLQETVSLHDTQDFSTQDVDCLVCPFFENAFALHNFPIEGATLQQLTSVIAYEKFSAKHCELVITHGLFEGDLATTQVKKFLLVGLGDSSGGISSFRKAFKTAFDLLAKQSISNVGLFIPNNINCDEEILDASIYCFGMAKYRFNQYKTKAPSTGDFAFKIFSSRSTELLQQLPYLLAEQTGMRLAKDLANKPANICTPDYLAARCKSLDASFDKISTTVIDEQTLLDLNMNSYLAVNKASSYAANMPVVHYTGAEENLAPIVLIGKGVTFDTGGISIKGASGMEAMIYDMAGAATVFGLMHAIALLDLPVNVIGILATAENCVDGTAYRPGDVLTTMSGKTVEVISTDAEGRLLLCDAISYAKRFKPKCIIDIATLTGAAITSLGHHVSGLMSNDNDLQYKLVAAGKNRHDRVWAFPIWDEYMETLDSTAADMKNTGTNSPGMITAACFLSKFTEDVPWAHLDIAGTSFLYGKQNTASGRPLPLLLNFVASHSTVTL